MGRISSPAELQAGAEIERQGGIAEDLLVMLTEQVVDDGVRGDVAVDAIVRREADVLITGGEIVVRQQQ